MLIAMSGFFRAAAAMSVGQCFNMQASEEKKALNASMTAEGLRFLIFANEQVIKPGQLTGTQLPEEGRLVLGSENGAAGYILHSIDTPLNTAAPLTTQFKRVCVAGVMHDVRLSDAKVPSVDPLTEIAGDPGAAEQQCIAERQRGGACINHNVALANETK